MLLGTPLVVDGYLWQSEYVAPEIRGV
eukprot:COSAG06_NODE_77988_length_112_cov_95.153846_1_plen_26_part_01